MTTAKVKGLPKEEWDRRRVLDITTQCSSENTVSPEMDAMAALSLMSRSGNSRLLVVEDGRLAGVITLKDLMRFFEIKLDLSEVK